MINTFYRNNINYFKNKFNWVLLQVNKINIRIIWTKNDVAQGTQKFETWKNRRSSSRWWSRWHPPVISDHRVFNHNFIKMLDLQKSPKKYYFTDFVELKSSEYGFLKNINLLTTEPLFTHLRYLHVWSKNIIFKYPINLVKTALENPDLIQPRDRCFNKSTEGLVSSGVVKPRTQD